MSQHVRKVIEVAIEIDERQRTDNVGPSHPSDASIFFHIIHIGFRERLVTQRRKSGDSRSNVGCEKATMRVIK